jgi:hypothetical protein
MTYPQAVRVPEARFMGSPEAMITPPPRCSAECFVIRGTRRNSITNCSDRTNAYGFHIPGPTHEMILTDHDVDEKNIETSLQMAKPTGGDPSGSEPQHLFGDSITREICHTSIYEHKNLCIDLLSTACLEPLRHRLESFR